MSFKRIEKKFCPTPIMKKIYNYKLNMSHLRRLYNF